MSLPALSSCCASHPPLTDRKGDGNIRYFELDDAAPYAHYISDFKSATPQRGLGWVPKRGVSVGECEVCSSPIASLLILFTTR